MKHVLFPTDFSEISINAINYGLQLLYGENHEIILLNTYDVPIPPGDLAIMPENYIATMKKESESGLVNLVKKLKENHPHLKNEIKQISKIGILSNVIKNYIDENPVDLIIMGTHGASGTGKMIMGSNAYDVTRSIHRPVLSIPENQKFITPRKLTLALDFKPIKNEKVFDFLLWLVRKFEAKLHVLNVVTPDDSGQENKQIREKQLDEFLNSVNHEYVFTEHESVEEGIMEYVERSNSEMLAMVIHDLSFFGRLFHPSTTKKVALNARLPLITVHG